MINIYSKKNNALNYAIAFFSGLTLLASGMAIAFPSAVLSLGLLVPLIAVCGTFSLISLILAGQAVSQNEVISEKEAELAEKTEDIKNKTFLLLSTDKENSKKDAIINGLNSQLAEKNRKPQKTEDDILDNDSDLVNEVVAESGPVAQSADGTKADPIIETGESPLETILGNGTPEKSDPDAQQAKPDEQVKGNGGVGTMFTTALNIATFGIVGKLGNS